MGLVYFKSVVEFIVFHVTLAVQQCPDRDCTKVCVNGYDLDREGCETCKCQSEFCQFV